jgi:hypothetical protein
MPNIFYESTHAVSMEIGSIHPSTFLKQQFSNLYRTPHRSPVQSSLTSVIRSIHIRAMLVKKLQCNDQ